jgi:PAS domain S-box-containing protein
MLSAMQGLIEHDAVKDLLWEGLASVLMDLDTGEILLVSTPAEHLFGYQMPGALVGEVVEILIPERFREQHVAFRKVYAENPKPRPMGEGRALTGLHRDGHEFPVSIALLPKMVGAGTFRRRCACAVVTPLTVLTHPTGPASS